MIKGITVSMIADTTRRDPAAVNITKTKIPNKKSDIFTDPPYKDSQVPAHLPQPTY